MALQQILYIPEEKSETWLEIRAAARAERRGIGFYLCAKWEQEKKIREADND